MFYLVTSLLFYREVFDVVPARLPVAVTREDNPQFCDICIDNGVTEQTAVSYCTKCSKRMCTKHKEVYTIF